MRLAAVLRVQNSAMFKTIIFIPGFLCFLLFFAISRHLNSAETGYKYFKNYSYKEYDHQPQNWGMAQAKNGILYVANHGGVLEFDGVSWRIIGIPGYATIRSLAIDEKGTVYIGGKGEIGFLTPGKKGSLKYHSLLGYLPDNRKTFSDVWKTYYAPGKGVYFHTSKFLFRWDGKQMKVWEPKERFFFSFMCGGKLFIRPKTVGLMEMVNDSLKPVPGGDMFITRRIFMMVPYDSERVLIGTRKKGFYIYNGSTILPFPTEVDDYLMKNKLYHGIRLSSGDFALATLLGGLIIMDPRGRLKHIFDKTSGLQDDKIYYVSEDNQGNLWLCLDKGISKIEYASPFFLYDDRSGLPGHVLSVLRLHNDLYAGTTNGLYYFKSPEKFHLIPGINSSCWSLLSIDNSILAATYEGVFQVRQNIEQNIIKIPSYALLPSKRFPGRIWCGTDKGLVVISRKKGRWTEEHRFETGKQKIRYIVEDKKGNLWLATSRGSVLKVDFPATIDKPKVTWYETSHGLLGGRVFATEAVGHVLFTTEKGIFRFDEKNNVFIPDKTLGDEFAGGSKPVFRLVEDKNKHIWFHSESRNFHAVPGTAGSFTIDSQPFCRIPAIQVNAIYPDPDKKTTWFASVDGLIRYDTTVKKNYEQNFNVLIRKAVVNGNLIFDGSSAKNGTGSKHRIYTIKYADRKNFHFEFAGVFFNAEVETRYRYLLAGHDDHWSDWGPETEKDFTTLDSGQYVLRVQAKNVFGRLGETTFQFRILPPWYRTWWAFLLYVMGFFFLLYLGIKWRSANLEQEKQNLEQTIKERTKEIREKNKQLKDQSEKLKEMDRVKSRFFANISHEFRTPLTLIMGPIEQMLSDSRDKKQQEKLNMMLRNSRRLLASINQLLDLSRFDSNKMKLHAACRNIVPFIKGIFSAFQLAARENRLGMEFHSEEEDISLYFDAPKMEDVMNNLLLNAFKFTSPGGEISVSLHTNQREHRARAAGRKSTPGFVDISVRDTGIGIVKEKLPHIFDRFYQVEGPGQEALKGTGIGLALIKENVALHHGKIDVHSQEGKGTEFVIRLPLGHEHLDPGEITDTAPAPPQPRKSKEIETLYMLTDSAVEEQYDEEPATANTPDQEKPVILVVEDHADVRKYICDPLKTDYRVIEAVDGQEGIEKAKTFIPDLIVSDIMMPEKDGYELCRALKRDIKTSHIPTILLTAKASEESIIRGLETGADDYITKPFNSRILATRIKNLIELRCQLQQKIQKQMLLQPDEIAVSSMDKEFIKALQEVIENNLSDGKFHVEALCKKLYMNRVTLFRKVKALTGESPTEFIRSYRLKRAAQLLRDNFGNVSEVAIEVGFSNLGYFTRCFKEKFQQLPSTYQAAES